MDYDLKKNSEATVIIYDISGRMVYMTSIDNLNNRTNINTMDPNPNNGNMELSYDLGNDNTATMKLFDVTGKMVNTYKLQNSKGIMPMNEQNLYNGIYFYHILVEGKIIKTDKIVIIK